LGLALLEINIFLEAWGLRIGGKLFSGFPLRKKVAFRRALVMRVKSRFAKKGLGLVKYGCLQKKGERA